MSDCDGGVEKRLCQKCLDEQKHEKNSEKRRMPSRPTCSGIDTQEPELGSPAEILEKVRTYFICPCIVHFFLASYSITDQHV
mmetsp:Transcript_11965/g.24755  ORF Transcript_11965/g.24755 Transcript_11965/m.24755 type:complete len:82 (+) Transcript_11965:3-248(+)